MCVFVTRGVIVQAHPLAVNGSVYPTQHNTTYARTRTHACTEREREKRERRMTYAHYTHTHIHTQYT